jgi:hypothetical protein
MLCNNFKKRINNTMIRHFQKKEINKNKFRQMKNGKCMLNNPLGKCCGPIVLQTIKRALQTNN